MTPAKRLKEIEKRQLSVRGLVNNVDIWTAYSVDVGFLIDRVKRLTEALEYVREMNKPDTHQEVTRLYEVACKALEEEEK